MCNVQSANALVESIKELKNVVSEAIDLLRNMPALVQFQIKQNTEEGVSGEPEMDADAVETAAPSTQYSAPPVISPMVYPSVQVRGMSGSGFGPVTNQPFLPFERKGFRSNPYPDAAHITATANILIQNIRERVPPELIEFAMRAISPMTCSKRDNRRKWARFLKKNGFGFIANPYKKFEPEQEVFLIQNYRFIIGENVRTPLSDWSGWDRVAGYLPFMPDEHPIWSQCSPVDPSLPDL